MKGKCPCFGQLTLFSFTNCNVTEALPVYWTAFPYIQDTQVIWNAFVLQLSLLTSPLSIHLVQQFTTSCNPSIEHQMQEGSQSNVYLSTLLIDRNPYTHSKHTTISYFQQIPLVHIQHQMSQQWPKLKIHSSLPSVP